MKRPLLVVLLVAVAIGLGVNVLSRIRMAAQSSHPMPAVPVIVEPVVRVSMPLTLGAVGSIEAFQSVTITSRVDGTLLRAAFAQGQSVRRGDLLFTIDPRPFEVLLQQARANLARDQAQLDNARRQVTRYSALVQQGFVSNEAYQGVRATSLALEGTVKADQAAIRGAELQLSYTRIHAPIAGIAGTLLVNAGNLIKANDTELVVINQVQPVYVTFALPAVNLPELQQRLRAGSVPVSARPPGDTPKTGQLAFINNAVDPATGTVLMKAVLANEDRLLTPGQFVDVELTLRNLDNVPAVPARAIQQDANGSFVFVVNNDLTVAQRRVNVLTTHQDRAAIGKGLSAGERVVTDGQLSLRPGVHVAIKEGGAAVGAPGPR